MFTGPIVLQMIGAPGEEISKPKFNMWRVFVQSTQTGFRIIHKDTLVLYQVYVCKFT